MLRGNIRLINHLNFCLLWFRVAIKISTNQSAIPTPIVLGISGGVNAYKSAARLDISFEIGLLITIQDILCCVEEYYSSVIFKAILVEIGGVFVCIHRKIVLLTELHDGGFANRNGCVPVTRGFAEYEDTGVTFATIATQNEKGKNKQTG